MVQVIKKICKLLNKAQKIRVVIIAIMMLAGGLLETIGVGLIIPLITAITDSEFIETNKYAKWFCDVFDLHTSRTFMLAVIIALISVYIFKNVYLFCEYYVQYRFVYNNRFATQDRLLNVYLQRPYEYFLNAESGEIVRVITIDTKNTFELLSAVLAFFTEAIISVALIIVIIMTDPLMAFLIAAVLGVLMLVINRIIKPILGKAGKRYQKNFAQMNKWLLQSISGIKEVKVTKKEEFFLKQFSTYGRKAVDSEKMNAVLSNVPRLSIEAFSISAMLAVIGFLMLGGREIDTMLPQLSAFAMAAVRLMPSVNRMSTSLNTVSYYESALDKMLEHLAVAERWEQEKIENQGIVETGKTEGNKTNCGERLLNANLTMENCKNVGADVCTSNVQAEKADILESQSERLTLNLRIELSDITFFYTNSPSPVLDHANMVIPVGKSIGLVGASGAGKTTAIDILLGLLKPQNGAVLSDGVNIQNDYSGWLLHLGYIPQMIFMLDDTIRANVAFGIDTEKVDDAQVWKALEEAQLKDFIESLPNGLDTTIGERGVRLSGGQRQRIGIARALYTDPELLIFDEATSALDNETEAAIMESINALHGRKTLIIIAHRLTTIAECDMVYRVEDGKIVQER